VRGRDFGPGALDDPPGAAAQEDAAHAGGDRGQDVVVQAVADVGDLSGGPPRFLDHALEERGIRLRDAPAFRSGDQVDGQIHGAQVVFGPARLVADQREPVAVPPQLVQRFDDVAVQVAPLPALGRSGRRAAVPLRVEVEARSQLLEGALVRLPPLDHRAQ
jgi:hypothetical protein